MDPNSSGTPLFISGDQQLVLSPEDAAQLLAQAGIQLGDNEQVIIGDAIPDQGNASGDVGIVEEETTNLDVLGQQQGVLGTIGENVAGVIGEGVDGGQVLYIDPNDPQAAEILQQAGLRLTEDGNVTSIASTSEAVVGTSTIVKSEIDQKPITSMVDISSADLNLVSSQPVASTSSARKAVSAPSPVKTHGSKTISASAAPTTAANSAAASKQQVLQVGPDQQQVMYTVTGEDGKTQQYMMLCPKDMDQNLLIQTLVKQISSDPNNKGGKKTIKITQQRGALQKITGLPPGSRVVSQTVTPSGKSRTTSSNVQSPIPATKRIVQSSTTKAKTPPATKRVVQQTTDTPAQQRVTQQAVSSPNQILPGLQRAPQSSSKNVLTQNDIFESVIPDLPFEPTEGGARVYVKCNYCHDFRSTLTGETWDAILSHILPTAKEEIQTTFYGDLSKHFIRSLRIQINGKQVVCKGGIEIPQCEVVLSHSLICRKTKREFIVSNPDANFVAGLAKHIQAIQPGNSGRGNSLLCIFCNSPFTMEDYLRHIQPHIESILATLNCFAGAYCAQMYADTIKAQRHCYICSDDEAADLRFLPCTKFSHDYSCVKKQQFAIDCFREHYGDSGFLRVNTSTVARCSVCKNSQQVYCAVFHISTQVIGEDETQQDVDTQLAVCVNCQKQFINIVMKEQGFEERLKMFQVKNVEQLGSVFRVIHGQAAQLCEQKKTFIYTVHENTSNPNSAVHILQAAEVTQTTPITRLMALAENEIVSSLTKAFFICDLCLFTADLTSMIATEADRQKNEMLLAIVLEHLVPHTESLMSVIASTASSSTFCLKYELLSRVHDMGTFRKIVVSLQKKFKSRSSNLEVLIDKDDEKTISSLRNGVKSERRNIVQLKQVRSGPSPGSTIVGDSSSAGQLVEVNKFIERQRAKLGIISQSGCYTTLLGTYIECKLCSKWNFPDFRLLAGAAIKEHQANQTNPKPILLCENCVEVVLALCLPTEPECLQQGEECLALGEEKLMGHRLVLSNEDRRWLSLDGVNLIKRTVDEFEEAKSSESASIYKDGLKRHISAVLKTCQRDGDITSCCAGFSITDAFLGKSKESDETAAALASLEEQIGVPIKQKRELKPNEIQVTILSRREKKKVEPKKTGTPSIVYPRGFHKRLGVTLTPSTKSTPTTSGQPSSTATLTPVGASSSKRANGKLSSEDSGGEVESVSAIQSFIEATSSTGEKTELKLPAGIKITPTGKGTVNIRAVSEASVTSNKTSTTVNSPKAKTSSDEAITTGSPSTSATMVTLTANGMIKRLPPNQQSKENTSKSDLNVEGVLEDTPISKRGRPTSSGGTKAKNGDKNDDADYTPDKRSGTVSSAEEESGTEETPTRSKRQRREKKIFDL